MKRLSEQSIGALNDYIAQLQALLGLKDWIVTISDEHWVTESSSSAEIDTTYGQKHAKIRVSQNFVDGTAEEQRYILTHELTHCHLDMLGMFIESDLLPKLISQNLPDVIGAIHHRLLETAVDGIAVPVAKLLPLPTWEAIDVED